MNGRHNQLLVLTLSFVGFIALGVSSGMLGVAWPSLRATFGLPLDALGVLLVANTAGFMLASVFAGRLVALTGIGPVLLLSNGVAGLGFGGYVLAPQWWTLILAGLLVGWGTGMIDAGLNIYVAATHSVRTMNWMHASFGLGATLGPLLMTAVLSLNYSWRVGFAVVAVAHGLLALGIGVTLRRWRREGGGDAADEAALPPARSLETLKQPLAWLSIAIFFVYTGVEGTAGQWTYTLFTESRGVDVAVAGAWVSLFWAGLTLGRVLLGAVAERVGVNRLLRLATAVAVVAAALIWVQMDLLNSLAMPLLGFALGPIFPTLTSGATQRVGRRHADNTIGFQTAAASLGIAVLPGLAGVLAEAVGLEIIGGVLVVLTIAMLLLHEVILARMAVHRRRAVQQWQQDVV